MKQGTNRSSIYSKAGWPGALIMALLTTMALAPALWAQESRIVRDYGDYVGYDARFADWVEVDPELDVEIWTDNESGSYYEGESIKLYFRSNFDCYVAVYNIDTYGRVNLIYPFDASDDPLIEGGRIYRIPDNADDYELIVQGPEGIENIQIVASRTPFPTPDWYEGTELVCDRDRDEYLDFINGRYFGCRSGCYRATDRVSFRVEEWDDYYYRPVYHHPWPVWRSYGWVYVDYWWGSSIYIDGYYYGIAPLYLPRVSLGHHVVTVYDSYGHCWEGPVTIHHNRPLYLDNTIIRTGAGVKSRYRSVRKSGYRAPERHGYRDVKITEKYKPRVTSKSVTRKSTTTTTTKITEKTSRQLTKGKALDNTKSTIDKSTSSRSRGFGYKRVDGAGSAGKVTTKESGSSASKRLKPYKTRTEKSATKATTTQKQSSRTTQKATRSESKKSRSSASKRKKSESSPSSAQKSSRSSGKSSAKKSEKKSSKKPSASKSKKSSSSKKATKAGKKDPPPQRSKASSAKSSSAKSSKKSSKGGSSKSSKKKSD